MKEVPEMLAERAVMSNADELQNLPFPDDLNGLQLKGVTTDGEDTDRESSEQSSSNFDPRSPQSSATSSVPPRAEEWDRELRHTELEDFGKALENAARAVYPNDKNSRYSQVYVLLICWQTQDPKLPVEVEISRLHEVLETVYHFDVEKFRIPNSGSHFAVSQKINKFIEVNNDSNNDLKIVYYAGHGRLSRTKELLWSTLPAQENVKSPIVVWSGVQRSLEMAQSDVLILLDCCSSGVANASEGNGVTELLCACPYDTRANGVGHYSFTHALTTELRLLSKKPCFSVGELYASIYTRIQSYLEQGIENERYPPPVHFTLTRDEPFIRGIELSVQDSEASDQGNTERSCPKRVRFEDTRNTKGHGESESNNAPNKRLRVDKSEEGSSREAACQSEHLEDGFHRYGPKDSLYPLEAPRALFAVRFREDIGGKDLSIGLFREWLRSIPAAVEEVRVEAGFKCFSTLLLITIPLSMRSYIPQYPAIFFLGAVKSSIMLPSEQLINQPSRNKDNGSAYITLQGAKDKGRVVSLTGCKSELKPGEIADQVDGKPDDSINPTSSEVSKHEEEIMDHRSQSLGETFKDVSAFEESELATICAENTFDKFSSSVLFCSYCGKSFNLKEDLERHISSYTNVNPHHCSLCQLSFLRGDLLQRHHLTYHKVEDLMKYPAGIASGASVACINCASAKTHCDKRVPCSRCAEKDLPCEGRFARRQISSRSKSFSNITTQHSRPEPQTLPRQECEPPRPPKGVLDSRLQGVSQTETDYPLLASHMASGNFGSLSDGTVRGMDTAMRPDSDMLHDEVNYYLNFLSQDSPNLDMLPSGGMDSQNQMPIHPLIEPYATSSAPGSITSTSGDTSLSSSHTRATSMTSHTDCHGSQSLGMVMPALIKDVMAPEFEGVFAAEEAWPLARCNPPMFPGSYPRTTIMHLENLEQHFKDTSTWELLEHNIATAETDHKYKILVVPLNASSRDRILAITQGFFRAAVEVHKGLQTWKQAAGSNKGLSFFILPPSRVLEYFLRSYVLSRAPYYTLVYGGTFDPNEVMLNNQASTLFLLLAIAYGAAALPTAQAACLAAGLIEICRISLFHIIESDIELSANPVVLRCALLFTILGAWSGDALHMNIAMGQRSMYLAMLSHAGMLKPSPTMDISNIATSTELIWREWQQREVKNRIVYNWVMVDQELSLFHDTALILSIIELKTPMPGSEGLWLARDAAEWLAVVQQSSTGTNSINANSLGVTPPTPSLYDLFQGMVHNNISRRYAKLSPLQLKLLLHPIQSLLYNLRQVLGSFSDCFGSQRGTNTVSKASTMLEEVQSLLQNWYKLCLFHANSDPICPVTRANLVLYHLISLNIFTSFPEIERLARKESFGGSSRQLSLQYKRCIYQPERAIIHCGQVIRLIYSMPREGRPHWWSAAVYRAALILWVFGLSRMDQNTQRIEEGQMFAINTVMLDDPAIMLYSRSGEGIPVLANGNQYFKLHPDEILGYCINLIGQGVALRMSNGIKRKLQGLSRNWSTRSI